MSAKRKNSFQRVKSAMFGKKALYKETRAFNERGDYLIPYMTGNQKNAASSLSWRAQGGADIALKLSAEDVERFQNYPGSRISPLLGGYLHF